MSLAIILGGCSSLKPPAAAGAARGPRAEVKALPAPPAARRAIDPDAPEVWAEVLTWTHESAICILSGSLEGFNLVRYRSDFFSPDGNQGSVISSAAWSPAGPYLAYQIHSSGGHQPYRSPIALVDVENWEELWIDDRLAELPGKESWCVTTGDDERGFSWSPDGRLHFAATSSDAQGGQVRGPEFTYDPGTREVREVEGAVASPRS